MFRQLLLIMLLGLALSVPVQAAQDIYGPIKRTDTLWNIALKLKPGKQASVQQVMLALYEKNKHAFTVNNINSIRKGAHMLAPTEDEALAISRKNAVNMVQRHNTRWKQGRYVPIHDPVPAELTKRLAQADGKTQAETDTQATAPETKTASTASPGETLKSEQATQTTEEPAITTTAEMAVPDTIVDGMPLEDQLRIVMQELDKAKQENHLLKVELEETRQLQQKGKADKQTPNPDIQAQLDTLRHELTELRTILTQKDNHIKTLQSSLKSASEAIKSQHADNMRLYNKLKELSPESIPAQAEQQSQPQIKLAAVTKNALTSGDSTSDKTPAPTNVWADGGEHNSTGTVQQVNSPQPETSEKGTSLSQLVNSKIGLAQAGGNSITKAYTVSPIAWTAVLLSFVFIIFLIIRSLVVQNELRKFERDNRI